MNIRFILLAIGLFLFTIGYVNQNKYNCNIIPSLEKLQEKELNNLFENDNVFINRRNNNQLYTYNEDGERVLYSNDNNEVGYRIIRSTDTIPINNNNNNNR